MSFSEADPLPGAELAAFVAAVESGTVQGAADALNLTQSAATKRIQRLEGRAGASLLRRDPRGVGPTALGQRLYPLAKQALGALTEAAAALGGTDERRELRISASQTPGEFLVPGWLAAFRAVSADVQAHLDVVYSPAVLAAVRDGLSEIGFVEGLDSLEGLEVLTVARDRLVVVVSAGHRWARRAAIRPQELQSEPYFSREKLSGTRVVAEHALATVGVTLTEAMSAASVQSLKRAVAGGGFTIISELSVEAELRAGTLVTPVVNGIDFRREIRAVRRRDQRADGPGSAFWTWLTELASQASSRDAYQSAASLTPGSAKK